MAIQLYKDEAVHSNPSDDTNIRLITQTSFKKKYPINVDHVLDWLFKLNVNLEELENFNNINDWPLIASIASIPSFYMNMEQIVSDFYSLIPATFNISVDWEYLINFLIQEGIWVVKIDS